MTPERLAAKQAGVRLWMRRMRLDLTQAELAELSLQPIATIEKLEKASRKVSRAARRAVEGALQAAERKRLEREGRDP